MADTVAPGSRRKTWARMANYLGRARERLKGALRNGERAKANLKATIGSPRSAGTLSGRAEEREKRPELSAFAKGLSRASQTVDRGGLSDLVVGTGGVAGIRRYRRSSVEGISSRISDGTERSFSTVSDRTSETPPTSRSSTDMAGSARTSATTIPFFRAPDVDSLYDGQIFEATAHHIGKKNPEIKKVLRGLGKVSSGEYPEGMSAEFHAGAGFPVAPHDRMAARQAHADAIAQLLAAKVSPTVMPDRNRNVASHDDSMSGPVAHGGGIDQLVERHRGRIRGR